MDTQPPPEADRNNTSWLFILVILVILAGFALTAFYGVRVLRAYRLMHRTPLRPGVTDVTLIRAWMTVPYIARAYRVPEAYLWSGLGIDRAANRYKSLRALDRLYHEEHTGAILTRVKDLITQYQAEHPTAPPGATPSPINSGLRSLPPLYE